MMTRMKKNKHKVKAKKIKKSSVNKSEKQQTTVEQPQQINLLDDLLGMGTSTSTP